MKVFFIKVTTGTSPGPFNIYYDENLNYGEINFDNLALIYGTSQYATGITYEQLSSDEGVIITVPDTARRIILYDTIYNLECPAQVSEMECDLLVEILETETVTPPSTDPNCEIFIPQGFSPNGDGIHDTFKVYNLECYPDNEMAIFNRNGNRVYYRKQYHLSPWDGFSENNWTIGTNKTKVPVGNYLYVLTLYSPTFSGNKKTFNGTVMVSY